MNRYRGRAIIAAVMMVFLLLGVTGCSKGDQESKDKEAERTIFAFDTVITLRAYGPNANKVLDKAFDRISEIEQHMSANIADSDIGKVNANPGKDIKVHDDTFFVIQKAKYYSQLSHGGFDVAILPIVKLWKIGTEELKKEGYPVPTQAQIDPLLDKVDYRLVTLNEKNKTVRLEKKGMGLDLGGIAKGYGADEVKKIYLANGIKSGIINMGGNVYAVGNKPDGTPWKVGIRNPRSPDNEVIHFAILQASDKSVVTSGDYERYFMKNGIRYHHIFDARTGKPSRSGLMSVTIVSDHSIDGDALSTTVFVLGAKEGLALVEKIPGIEAMAVTTDKKVYETPGMKKMVKITNEEYKAQP